MSDYKLVPTELTDEMIEASGCEGTFRVNPRVQAQRMWEAMLAAAPAVQGEPVVEEVTLFECASCNHLHQVQVTQCDCMPDEQKFNRWLARPERTAPDVSALVKALECMIIGACAVAVPHNGERAVLQDAVNIARAALDAHRKGGDQS